MRWICRPCLHSPLRSAFGKSWQLVNSWPSEGKAFVPTAPVMKRKPGRWEDPGAGVLA